MNKYRKDQMAFLRALLREQDYRYDPWGVCMEMLFTIAEVLHFERYGTPEHWEYNPGAASAPEGGYLADGIASQETQTLIDFGNILFRWTRALKSAGRDY